MMDTISPKSIGLFPCTRLVWLHWCWSPSFVLVISVPPHNASVLNWFNFCWLKGQGHSHLPRHDFGLDNTTQEGLGDWVWILMSPADCYIKSHMRSVRKINSWIIHRSIIQTSVPSVLHDDLAAHQHLCFWLNTCMNSCVSSTAGHTAAWFHSWWTSVWMQQWSFCWYRNSEITAVLMMSRQKLSFVS